MFIVTVKRMIRQTPRQITSIHAMARARRHVQCQQTGPPRYDTPAVTVIPTVGTAPVHAIAA